MRGGKKLTFQSAELGEGSITRHGTPALASAGSGVDRSGVDTCLPKQMTRLE